MTSKIITASKSQLDDISVLFDNYRQFYQMESNLDAAKCFINDRLSLQDSIIYMAYSGEKPQGFVQIYPSFSSVAMQRIWTLNDLYINKQERRLGAASILLNHVIEQARQAKVFSLKLVTTKDNLSAKALYESFGFQLNSIFDSYSIRP